MFQRLMSIGVPSLVGLLAVAYFLNGARALLKGEATARGGRISRNEKTSLFNWYVRGRIFAGTVLFIVAVGLAYVLSH